MPVGRGAGKMDEVLSAGNGAIGALALLSGHGRFANAPSVARRSRSSQVWKWLNATGRSNRVGGKRRVSRRHAQGRQHRVACVGAGEAGVGTDAAMLVHLRMMSAFAGAGAAEGDAGGELRFQELPVAGLVGPRDDGAGGGADLGAIKIEADAGNKPRQVRF